ncbi:hypothetical protein [Arthrobacter sp. A2-55]|uniref:hypothetical protein n=1 Tax=Arthrobacter sp. A2-55 TaxID=2897337 RepID=UPI0021CDE1B0|nr:hypothetical protein [Arthrobacter sp. A2-55]MCU6480488.1 hypothetical protein [Arthrobacter sp. A2-55]
MSSPAIAFRARQREIIAAHIEGRKDAVAAYNDRLRLFLFGVGSDKAHGIQGFNGSFWVGGYQIPVGTEPQEGWRRDSKKPHMAVPAKKTPEGKRLADEVLPRIGLAAECIPGAPDSIVGGGYRAWPRVQTVGAEHFLTFSQAPDRTPIPGLDLNIWEPVGLSVYYAAREAAEEAVVA